MIVSYSEEDQVKKECKSKVDEIVDMLKLDSKRIAKKTNSIKGAVQITESLFDGIDIPDLKTSESQNVLSKLAICLAWVCLLELLLRICESGRSLMAYRKDPSGSFFLS